MQQQFVKLSWLGSLLDNKRDAGLASGLTYRRNRYVDGRTGRFTQPDPIGLAGGLNSYGFGSGDPVSFTDPFGLCPPQNWDLSDCPGIFTVIGAATGALFGGGGGAGVGALGGPAAPLTVPAGAVAGAAEGLVVGAAAGAVVDGAIALAKANIGGLIDAAKAKYPRKASRTDECHHNCPKYLGGDPNGPTTRIPAAYHQEITNAFRRAWDYGSGKVPSAAQLDEILRYVYSRFPLP